MIVDRIIQSIANATTPVAFPSSSELDAASESLRTAQVRLDAATALTTNMEHLVEGATQAVLDKFPQAKLERI